MGKGCFMALLKNKKFYSWGFACNFSVLSYRQYLIKSELNSVFTCKWTLLDIKAVLNVSWITIKIELQSYDILLYKKAEKIGSIAIVVWKVLISFKQL